ncbi:MAG: aminotransferase class V-fold PLP-dependent enzyme, partial [Eubacterium sp.]
GHKGLRGPQGIGGIVFTERMAGAVSPLIEGGTGSVSDSMTMPSFMPDRFEAGTLNLPGIYGLNAALSYLEEVDEKSLHKKEQQLTAAFIEGIKNNDALTLIGSDRVENRCPVVSITCESRDLSEIAFELDRDYGIMTRVGLHCAPVAHRTLGTYPNGTLRFSFGPDNTFEEIEETLKALTQIVKE